uniref:Kinetochore protein SPC25 n=1 Tax=Heterorhabditis bacteriophora TaxID=37862 RepID=A0A1I7X6H6_HETBA
MEDLLKEARKKNSSMDQEELRLQKTIKETVEKVEEMDCQLKALGSELAGTKRQKDINMNIIHDFTIKVKRFEHERELLEVAKKKYNDHLSFQDNLKKQRLGEFMEGFERIGLALKEMYQMITLGGDAALDLKDSMDPFSEGIQFMLVSNYFFPRTIIFQDNFKVVCILQAKYYNQILLSINSCIWKCYF